MLPEFIAHQSKALAMLHGDGSGHRHCVWHRVLLLGHVLPTAFGRGHEGTVKAQGCLICGIDAVI